jgi:1-acyl-sn-glycerol-3-phosphate acyltransferase
LLLFAWPKVAPSNTGESGAMFDAMQGALAQVKSELRLPGLAFHVIGPHRSYLDNAQQIKYDLSWIAIASLLSILILTFITMRRLWLSPFSLIPSLFGVAFAITLVGFSFKEFSLIVLGMASALLGVTDDYGLHLLHAIERTPENPAAAARQIRWPVILGALATALTFLTLLFTHFPGQYRLAIFSAVGVLAAAAFALLGLPHLVPKTVTLGKSMIDFDRFSDWVENGRSRHPFFITVLFIILVVLAFFGCQRVRFLGDPEALNYLTAQTHAEETAFARDFGEPTGRMFVFLHGRDEEEALQKAEHLDQALSLWNREGWPVEGASVAAMIPSIAVQKSRRAAFEAAFGPGGQRLRAQLEAAGQRQGFEPGVFREFTTALRQPPAWLTMDDFKSAGFTDLLTGRVISVKGQFALITPVKPGAHFSSEQLHDRLKAALPEAVLVDRRSLASEVLNLVRQDLLPLALMATVVTIVVVFLASGRIEMVMVVLIPLATALLLTFGTMGWLGLPINLINIAIIPLIFGLGADLALFRLESKHMQYRRKRFPSGSIYTASATTLSGFGLLAFAKHPTLQTAGSTILIGISWALIASLVIVPTLMDLFFPREEYVPPRSLKTILGGTLMVTYLFIGLGVYFLFIHPLYLLLKLFRPQATFQGYLRVTALMTMRFFPYGRRIRLACNSERFPQPCIIVANHESQADIILILSLPVNQRMVIKNWVWNNPITGPLVRCAGFLLTTGDNAQALMDAARKLLASGVSIMMFPEGSRSKQGGVQRFHKGAFQLSVETGVPVVPVALVDTRSSVRDNTWIVGPHACVMQTLDSMDPRDFAGEDQVLRMAREARSRIRDARQKLHPLTCPDSVVRQKVKERFGYLGPWVENYIYWKMRLDPIYPDVCQKLPERGRIIDLGCGYGIMGHWAAITGPGREIIGVDADDKKIETALETVRYQPGLQFIRTGILDFQAEPAGAVLLLDVLHYWSYAQQAELARKARSLVTGDGILFFRDACMDSAEQVLPSERWSTAIGLNKKYEGLFFRTRQNWIALFEASGFRLREDKVCGLGRANHLFVFDAILK